MSYETERKVDHSRRNLLSMFKKKEGREPETLNA